MQPLKRPSAAQIPPASSSLQRRGWIGMVRRAEALPNPFEGGPQAPFGWLSTPPAHRPQTRLQRGRLATGRALMTAIGMLLAVFSPATGQQRTLIVAGYGGSFEQAMRKELFPGFEAKHGVKIEYVAGNSTDSIAKLQAQKGNQQIDVAIVDDGPMYQAIQ